jgi:hypothetical protein
VGEVNYGRLPSAVTDMDKIASQLTVEMPGSLPELAASVNSGREEQVLPNFGLRPFRCAGLDGCPARRRSIRL